MQFSLSPDQRLFAETTAQLLADRCPPARVRDAWNAPPDDALWKQLADMGVIGLLAPEPAGGLGLDDLDLSPLLVESGRSAMVEPIVDTAAIAVPLLAAAGHDALDAVVNGDLVVAVGFANDTVVRVDADALLLERDDGGSSVWHLVDVDDLEVTAESSVDGSRRLGAFAWAPTAASLVTDDPTASPLAFDRGVVGLAAQLVGLASHLLDVTVEYVGQREQFGRPIGSQQALKHKLADVLLAVDFARPMVTRAAHSLAGGDPDASIHAAVAKCYANDAALLAARHALQCHGAIAYTIEYDLHMWMKRVWALAAQWGDTATHRRRVAEHLGLAVGR